jgi:hypothetical protein
MSQIMLHSPNAPQALSQRCLLFFLRHWCTTHDTDGLPPQTVTTSYLHGSSCGDKFRVEALTFPHLDVNPRFSVLITSTLRQKWTASAMTSDLQTILKVNHVLDRYFKINGLL